MISYAMQKVDEGETALVEFVLKRADGTALLGPEINTLTATLVNVADKTMINGRDNQDILGDGSGDNGAQIDAAGNVDFYLGPADNPFLAVATSDVQEQHHLVIRWKYQDVYNEEQEGAHNVLFNIRRKPSALADRNMPWWGA